MHPKWKKNINVENAELVEFKTSPNSSYQHFDAASSAQWCQVWKRPVDKYFLISIPDFEYAKKFEVTVIWKQNM